MSPINAVMRRELRSYFVTPAAYVFLVIASSPFRLSPIENALRDDALHGSANAR